MQLFQCVDVVLNSTACARLFIPSFPIELNNIFPMRKGIKAHLPLKQLDIEIIYNGITQIIILHT